jgi:hypothetical protein
MTEENADYQDALAKLEALEKNAQPTTPEIEVSSDIEFFVKGVSVKNATIQIWRFVNGEWKSRTYMVVTPGEPIGGIYVSPPRQGRPSQTIDYGTGATLVDIDPVAARQKKLILAEPVTTEQGVTTEDKIRLMPDTYRGKIVYLDKQGELQEKWMGKQDLEELYRRFPGPGSAKSAAEE